MKRLITSAALSIVVCAAMALPAYVGIFGTKYKVKPGSALGNAKCKICHSAGKNLNPYGKDLEKAAGAAKKVTADVLAKVEGLDSNGNGATNAADIKADKNPGVR